MVNVVRDVDASDEDESREGMARKIQQLYAREIDQPSREVHGEGTQGTPPDTHLRKQMDALQRMGYEDEILDVRQHLGEIFGVGDDEDDGLVVTVEFHLTPLLFSQKLRKESRAAQFLSRPLLK